MFKIPIIIDQFPQHNQIKNDLLKMIENTQSSQIKIEDEKISKADWQYNYSRKEYMNIIIPHSKSILKKHFESMNYSAFHMGRHWFQQYETSDFHDWHRHPKSDWNFVYYVELPEDSPATEFRNPLNSNETFIPNVKEGDFILFPSLLEHRSAINNSARRKTVIAINFDIR